MNYTLMSAEEFLPTLVGGVIRNVVSTEDGMHFELEDGRVLILVGVSIIYVGRLEATH